MRVGGRRLRITVDFNGQSMDEERARPVILAFGALVATAMAIGYFYGQGWGWVTMAGGLAIAAIMLLVWDYVAPIDDPPDEPYRAVR